jgi:hypothetical protein
MHSKIHVACNLVGRKQALTAVNVETNTFTSNYYMTEPPAAPSVRNSVATGKLDIPLDASSVRCTGWKVI